MPDPRLATRYIGRALSLDPLQDAYELMLARERVRNELGLTGDARNDEATPIERRRWLDDLDEVRRDLWSSPPEEIAQRLTPARSATLYPEVVAAADRLAIASECRDALDAVVDEPIAAGFAISLKRLLASRFADRIALKRQVGDYLVADRTRLRSAKRSLTSLKRRCPRIYALEDRWFRDLARRTCRPTGVRRDRQRRVLSLLFWAVLSIALAALIAPGDWLRAWIESLGRSR